MIFLKTALFTNLIFSFFLSLIWFFFIPIRKQHALRAIKEKLNLNALEAKKLLFKSIFNFFQLFGEGLIFKIFPNYFLQLIEIPSSMPAKKQSFLIYALHLGGFNHIPHLFSLLGYEGYFMVRKTKNPFLQKFMNYSRSGPGVHPVEEGKGLKTALRGIEKNKVFAMMGDQHSPSKNSLYVDFLGEPASYSPLIIKLQYKYNLDLYLVNLVRKKGFKFKLVFDKLPLGDNLEASKINFDQILLNISGLFSGWIKRYPDQWFWLHKRWKQKNS